jgi:hypothetical protein
MSKTKINIESINLNFAGIPPGNLKLIADGLGKEILSQLSNNKHSLNNKTVNNIRNIDAGKLKIGRSENISDVRRTIASRISSEVIVKSRQS